MTVAGENRRLARPFHVLATQNPIEQEGTYPLPEAQLDRFLLQIDVDYPSRSQEREIMLATTGVEDAVAEEVLDAERLIALQRLVRTMPVGEAVVEAILNLVRSARPDGEEAADIARGRLAWGPGPRAAQALMLAVRARALLDGRLAPSVGDVLALAEPALSHPDGAHIRRACRGARPSAARSANWCGTIALRRCLRPSGRNPLIEMGTRYERSRTVR